MAAPRFTVLLPTHNRADVLGHAISSVLAQTEPDFELLIVADGCTDSTRDVVAAFKDPRIRFFDLPKEPGIGYANRNIALREARGHYVAYAAHDDLLLPDHLQLMGAVLDENGGDFAYSRPLWVSTDGIVAPYGTNLELADEFARFMDCKDTMPSSCVLITRSALLAAGYWPEDMLRAGDAVLWQRVLLCTDCRPVWLRTPTCLHFTAGWKKTRHSDSEPLRWMLRIADSAAWWPAILHHPPREEPVQRIVWRAIESGGTRWLEALREAADTVINRIAWMAMCELLPALSSSADAAAQLREYAAEIWAGRKPGPLAGALELITPASQLARAQISGWAMDMDNPSVPILLEITLHGKVIGLALACRFRADLLRAGLGDGKCAFVQYVECPLREEDFPGITVRRASDGATLPRNC
jgi:hypothetical protein